MAYSYITIAIRQLLKKPIFAIVLHGGMPEWLKGTVLKTVRGESSSRVRISLPPQMKYLGIDYGEKRVGIALSDDGGSFAFPHTILKNSLNLITEISELSKKEGISAIVLGESHDLSGKPNKIMGSIEEFKRNLEAETELPVYFQKEFMTTVEARGREGKEVNNARKVSKGQQAAADASAAALILQRYLDKKNN
jgi:putative Holliday junction resolvase